MPKAKDARADKAFELYKQGHKLTEIAAEFNIAEGTVRSWKNRYDWDGKSNATLQKNNRNVAKKKSRKKSDSDEQKNVKIAAVADSDLNEKQRLFCLYFVNCRNKVKAYQKAYKCTYENACSHASELWKNGEIQKEINRLLDEYREEIKIDTTDLFHWYLDIARADINDFIEIKDGKIKVYEHIDGTVIDEIYNTKHGIRVKLNDRIKALEWLGEHIGLASEKQRVEIELMKSRADSGKDDRENKLDKFLEQLEGELKNVE